MAVKFVKGEEALQSAKSGIVIVNAFATWCGPCKLMAPELEKVSENTPVYKVDIDENQEWAQAMNVQGVPTTMIFKDGKLADTIVGYAPKEAVEAKL